MFSGEIPVKGEPAWDNNRAGEKTLAWHDRVSDIL